MPSKSDLNTLIFKYSKIYEEFEKLQNNNKILPKGDQKTGVIGEYYAKCYANTIGKEGTAEYASPGDVFDLSYIEKETGKKFKVQVKCVSSHSKTRIMAPLNLALKGKEEPFDFLYLISLDINFKPDGFYINTYEEILEKIVRIKKYDDISNAKQRISGLKMEGYNCVGSKYLDFSENLYCELNLILELI